MTEFSRVLQRWGTATHTRWGSIFLSVDILIGLFLGVAAFVLALIWPEIIARTQDLLPTVATLLGAAIAVAIAAHTLLISLLSPGLIEVIKKADGGLDALSVPYKSVAWVSLAGTLVAVVVYVGYAIPAPLAFMPALGVGVVAFFTAWSLVGVVQLVGIGAYVLSERQRLADVISVARKNNAA